MKLPSQMGPAHSDDENQLTGEETLTQTLVESALEVPRELLYRRRHAALSGAGNFLRLVAEGGMGAIILVEKHPVQPDEQLVLKLLREEFLQDPDKVLTAAERFRRELGTHYRLSDKVPRIVPCLGFNPSENPASIYGVFPYFPEGSLSDFMNRGASVGEGLTILADAIEGLQSLHGFRTVHRDFCAGNIFVVREAGRPKGILGDLGIAIPLDGNTIFSAQQVQDDTASPAGHAGYIDPNYWAHTAGDFYSVGATIYWLITGKHPPARPRPEGIILPPLPQCRPGITEALHQRAAKDILSMTRPEENLRLQTAREVRSTVLKLAELWMEAPPPIPVPGDPDAPVPPSTKTRRRWPPLGILGFIILLFGIGFGVHFLKGTGTETEKTGIETRQDPADGKAETQTITEAPVEAEVAEAPPNSVEDQRRPTEVPTAIPPRVPLPESRFKAANALVDSGAINEAVSYLQDLLDQYPADPKVSGLLATLLSRGSPEELQEAERVLRESLAEHPDHGELRLALARAYAQDGKISKAGATLSQAPENSSRLKEIRSLTVTLSASAHQED